MTGAFTGAFTGAAAGWRAALALAGWLAAGTACSALGGGDRLSDAQQVIADMKIGPSGLTITGGVDRADRAYRAGEPITLSAEVNRVAYVAVLRVLPNGATTLVFPNKAQPVAQVAANSPLRIPGPGVATRLSADQPEAVLFEFIASANGGSWLFGRKPQGAADFAELGTTTRALAKDIVDSLKPRSGRDTAAASVIVRVAAP